MSGTFGSFISPNSLVKSGNARPSCATGLRLRTVGHGSPSCARCADAPDPTSAARPAATQEVGFSGRRFLRRAGRRLAGQFRLGRHIRPDAAARRRPAIRPPVRPAAAPYPARPWWWTGRRTSSRSQVRTVQSQTPIRPRTRNSPRMPRVLTSAASSIQRMLRRVASASSNAVGGSAGRVRNSASTPARCACKASNRRISRSNSRSRTGPFCRGARQRRLVGHAAEPQQYHGPSPGNAPCPVQRQLCRACRGGNADLRPATFGGQVEGRSDQRRVELRIRHAANMGANRRLSALKVAHRRAIRTPWPASCRSPRWA